MLLIVKPTTYLPTVPRDSGELIQLLENTVLPNSSCFLVTAEVASLYPNVDTKKAVVALDLLHRDARVPETPLLIQLARLVLDNNYLSSESVQSGHFSSRVLYCFEHSFRRYSGKTLLCIFTRKILWSSTPNFSCSIGVSFMTFLSFGVGPGYPPRISRCFLLQKGSH